MTFQPADRVYVDESKARGYYIVATATAIGDVQASERALRDLLKPGQRRIHFKSESDSRRRQILSRICALEVRVSVWVVKERSDKEARPLSLGALAEEAARTGVAQLIIERDESLERADRRLIADVIRRAGSPDMQYGMSRRTSIRCSGRVMPSPGATRTAATGSVASMRSLSPESPGCRNT